MARARVESAMICYAMLCKENKGAKREGKNRKNQMPGCVVDRFAK